MKAYLHIPPPIRSWARHSGYADRIISSYYYGERVVSEPLARSLVALGGSARLAAKAGLKDLQMAGRR